MTEPTTVDTGTGYGRKNTLLRRPADRGRRPEDVAVTWTDAMVISHTLATPDIAVIDLAPADNTEFPAYTAGAHIDVRIDSGMVRQYSLCGPPQTRHYRLAVLNEPNSRGGSRAMHALKVGDRLQISTPRNRFPLVPARRHLLFAGGIGITPLIAMLRHLGTEGGEYQLHYCARSRTRAAFLRELADSPHVTLHLDDGDPDQMLDIARDLGDPQPDTAVYVCGPGGFMDHVWAKPKHSAGHHTFCTRNGSATTSPSPNQPQPAPAASPYASPPPAPNTTSPTDKTCSTFYSTTESTHPTPANKASAGNALCGYSQATPTTATTSSPTTNTPRACSPPARPDHTQPPWNWTYDRGPHVPTGRSRRRCHDGRPESRKIKPAGGHNAESQISGRGTIGNHARR